jgi:hypothetical protein
MGDQYAGLISGPNQDYIFDPVRGYQVRVSNDGLTPISELYKGQYLIRGLLTPYNKEWTRGGGVANIFGCYDYLEEECIAILQGGTSGDDSISDYAFSFNERRNGYASFFDFHPEWITCAEENLYSWKEGVLYIHNNETYCNFYGTQYDAYIKVPFNQAISSKKTWLALTEIASRIWDCPEITTSLMSYGATPQSSNLIEEDFEQMEGQYHAAFRRDVNSIGGIIEGDSLKGSYIIIKFRLANASSFAYLNTVSVKFIESPINNR